MTRAFVFPGQGSQHVGMGRALYEAFSDARLVFEEVDEALHQDLSRIVFDGPESDLRLTENAQPALMATSLAAVRVLEREGGVSLAQAAAYVAGHSLGEYSALAAAGALSLADTARLLKLRGQAMQKAVPVGEGAMAALLGVDLEVAEEVTAASAQGEVCAVANDNAPGQVVLSGTAAAVERAMALARERGAKRAILLPVSAPFHCALMTPAAETMRAALAGVDIAAPEPPVVTNVSAAAVRTPATIRAHLVAQVSARVRWQESILYLKAQGVDTVVELGAGRVLRNLARRVDPAFEAYSVETPEDVETFLATLGKGGSRPPRHARGVA